MSFDNTGNSDPSNGDEQNLDDFKPQDDLNLEDMSDEDVRKFAAEAAEKNKQLFGRAKGSEEKYKSLRDDPRLKDDPEPKPADKPSEKKDLPAKEDDTDLRSTVDKLNLSEEKRQFGSQHKLSAAQVDFAFQVSGGKPTAEMLEQGPIKAALSSIASDEKVANNTPSTDGNTGELYKGKTYEEVMGDPKSTKEDRQSSFEKRRDAILSKTRRR